MQKEWSSFRVTLLLYSMILLFPLSLYYVHISFEEMKTDTKITQETTWLSETFKHLSLQKSDQNSHEHVKKILDDISLWVKSNKDNDLYIGAESLEKDFSTVQYCWEKALSGSVRPSEKCLDTMEKISVNIAKMVYLKIKHAQNMFYIYIVGVFILFLLLIYFVRVYIEYQIEKNAIYDTETKLFNRKYLNAEIKSTCARAARYDYPLTLLSISIENLESANYDEKTKQHLLEVLGGLIISIVRTSDVACRYNDNHIVILLPFTEEQNAHILEERLRTLFESHDFMVSPSPTFKFSIVEYIHGESPESCLERTEAFLS